MYVTTQIHLKNIMLRERSHKMSLIIWAYLYELSRTGKPIEMGAGGKGE